MKVNPPWILHHLSQSKYCLVNIKSSINHYKNLTAHCNVFGWLNCFPSTHDAIKVWIKARSKKFKAKAKIQYNLEYVFLSYIYTDSVEIYNMCNLFLEKSNSHKNLLN